MGDQTAGRQCSFHTGRSTLLSSKHGAKNQRQRAFDFKTVFDGCTSSSGRKILHLASRLGDALPPAIPCWKEHRDVTSINAPSISVGQAAVVLHAAKLLREQRASRWRRLKQVLSLPRAPSCFIPQNLWTTCARAVGARVTLVGNILELHARASKFWTAS